MESWCFDSLDQGFISSEIVSTSDSINRNRSVFMGRESKPSFSYENSGVFPNQQCVENPCFPEMGIAEVIKKPYPHCSTRTALDDNASFGDVISPGLVTFNGVSGDEESSSKLSSTVIDSNSQESSLIDLKLGGFSDKPDSYSTRTAHVSSSEESSTPPKKARVTSLSSQTAYCQVYGCHKDLSSAKDYHKRHKVCDVHSKTSKVIVNGVEQRFCQQCSRFHLLGEFDDGKRSCRKRLVGHNERRRKPQVGFTSRSGSSFWSYTGRNIQGFNPRSTSFICQDMLPSGASHMEKSGANDWVRQINIEDRTGCTQKPAYNCFNEQLNSNSTSPPCAFEKPFPFLDNLNNSGPKSVIEENVNPYTPEIVSHSLWSEDLTLLEEASTVEGLPGISESSRALSLLSRETSGHSFRVPEEGPPLFIPSNYPHYSVNEVSAKLFGAQNGYPMSKFNPTRENQPNSMLARNNGAFANVTLQSCGEDGNNTIDLLQLSSQLHRVENQRQSEPLQQEETGGFFGLKMT